MAKVGISFKGVACIYSITSPSGKTYIGQTWDLYHRYKSGVSKSQRLLYRSYKKYGVDAHILTVLKKFEGEFTQADLDHWELWYIKDYKSKSITLLNIRDGGGNTGKLSEETKAIIGAKSRQWKKDNPELVRQIALHAAASNIGRKRSAETKALQSKAAIGKPKTKEHSLKVSIAKKGKPSPHKGKHFSPEAVERIRAGIKSRRSIGKPINQYNLNGEFIKMWPSISDAARSLKLHPGTINGCVLKKPNYKTCGGFIWRYKTDLLPISPDDHKQTYNSKKTSVIQLDKSGAFIAQYESVKVASLSTGTNRTNIFKCCKGERVQAGGFTWRYK